MPNDNPVIIQVSELVDFVDEHRPAWLAEELAHRPFLRLGSRSTERLLCLTVRGTHDRPHGFACLIEDDQIILSPMPPQAVAALADYLTQYDLRVPGIFAPEMTGLALSDALRASRGNQYSVVKRVLHWELTALARQSKTKGHLRLATDNDTAILVEMYRDMQHEMNTQRPYDAQQKVTALMARQELVVWDNCEGRIVSTGAASNGTGQSRYGEIGSIYTPPDHRGQGFASALVSHLAEKLLEQNSAVFLSSDAEANASFQLYEKLGFKVDTTLANLRL